VSIGQHPVTFGRSDRPKPRVARRVTAALGLMMLALSAFVAPVGAQTSTTEPEGPPAATRMLVISLPTVTWADLQSGRYPHLRALAAQSAIAGLTTRPVRPDDDARAGDAYLTVGAGSRAETPAVAAGLAFGRDEVVDGVSGEEWYANSVGSVLGLDIGQVAWPEIVVHNASLLYDAQLSSLGTALRAAGLDPAVIGNADTPGREAVRDEDDDVDTVPAPYHREIALMLLDEHGQIDGRVDAGLLQPARSAPYGVVLDTASVLQVFDELWTDHDVIAVEASDLARVQAFAQDGASEELATRARVAALGRADELVGELVARTDAATDAVVVVAPYHASPGVDLTVAMLRAPGIEPGLLTSAATGRNGYVMITDLGPTITKVMGVPTPEAMEGTLWERGSTGGDDVGARIDRLVENNQSAKMRDDTITSATVVLITAAVIVLVAGIVLLARPSARSRRVLPVFALVVPGFLLGTHLVLVFPIAQWWWGWYWVIVLSFAVGFAFAVEVIARGDAQLRVLVGFGAIVVFHVVNQVVGAPLELDSVFGYTATVGIRISGLGNQSFAEMSIAALVVAAVAWVRLPQPIGRIVAFSALGITLIVIGAPFWGADFGGLLAATPAYLVFVLLATGRRLRVRTVIVALVAAVALALIAGFVDLARPEGERTHIGRFFERVGRDGFRGFWTVIERKASLVFEVFGNPWVVLLIVGLLALVAVAGRWWWREIAPTVEPTLATLRPMLLACGVVAVLGFSLNDSGIVVPGTMLAVLVPALIALTPTESADRADAPSSLVPEHARS